MSIVQIKHVDKFYTDLKKNGLLWYHKYFKFIKLDKILGFKWSGFATKTILIIQC